MINSQPDKTSPANTPECSAKTAKLRKELFELRSRNTTPEVSEPQSVNAGDNQRHSARYELSIAAVCYLVLPTGEVDLQSAIAAVLADGGIGGMKLWIDSPVPTIGREMLIGVEHNENQLAWFGTRVVGGVANDNGHSELNLSFAGSTNDLLQCEVIAPTLDRQQMQYRLPASDAALKSLVAVGAAHRLSLDYLTVCPACSGLPTVRMGCGMCLSAHTETKKMIHHYACAHVDFIENFEFETDGRTELLCQKCRCRNMIVGSDYEYLEGPNRCSDCGQSNLDLSEIGHCLSCSNRFLMTNGQNLELIGYRVNRMDILDIIHTA